MPEITFTKDDPAAGGVSFTKDEPPKAELPWYERAIAQPLGRGEVHGVGNIVTGAGQLLSRLPSMGHRGFAIETTEPPREISSDIDAYARARAKAYHDDPVRQAHPFMSGIGEFGGEVLATAPTLALGGGSSLLGRIGSQAAQGAVTAAANPVTEGNNFGSHKLTQTVLGGALGGVLGGAAEGAGSLITRLVGRNKAAADVEGRAADVVASRLAQDTKYGGPTATDAMQQIADARATKKPFTLVDVGGENVTALGGYTIRQPGASRALGRGFLKNRDDLAAQRLGEDVSQHIFGGPTMYQATEDLLHQRSRNARPLYEQAEALKTVWSPRLQEFIGDPVVKSGLSRGYELERLDALSEGRPFDPHALGIDLDFEGNIILKKVPNLRVLDMGKRGLDAIIADERDKLTGRLTARGLALSKVRQAYVGEIDARDPSGIYKAARDAWAGPSKSLDATRYGRTIFNRSPEETAAEFAKLSPNDQEFVRLGVADVLRERIAKTGFTGNEANAIIKNAWTQDQLRPIFPDPTSFDKFANAVMAEHTMARTTGNLTRGSQTAERVAEDKVNPDALYSAGQMASHVVKGNFLGALVHAWRLQNRLRRDVGTDPALNEAVAKIIFNPNIEVTDPAVQRMISGPPTYRSREGEAFTGAAPFAAQAGGIMAGEVAR